VEITPQELEGLLAAARIVREEDTRLAGMLRVLELDDRTLIQEQTFDGQPLVRRMESAEAALAFVVERLATYERMWDGCGCKVDHYA